MTDDLLRRLFDHDLWANARLFAACAELTDEQLDAAADPTTPWTIRQALEHIVIAQEAYVSLLTVPPEERRPPEAPPFDQLADAARTHGETLRAVGLGERAPYDAPLRTSKGAVIEPWVVLVQSINHATDHRRQVCGILRAQGLPAPRLDGWGQGEDVGAYQPVASD